MKYHIITYGCQMNKSDSERIASVLENIGYQPALNKIEADLIVVNMCSVRQSAVDRVYGLFPKFKKLKERNPKLRTVLTGCILKKDKERLFKKFDLILNIKDLANWSKYLYKEKGVKSKPWQLFYANCDYFKIKPRYRNNSLAYIPISNGCNFNCAYCVVPFVRGDLFCRNHKEILKEAKEVIKKGFKEIWLLGQNVNDYKSPISQNITTNTKNKYINFAKLIKMIDEIPGDFKFFFTSPHPKNFSNEIIDTLAKCKKFGKYLNLPVQSGDDEILKKMKRNYTVREYKELVKKIRKKVPDISLSTDIIVGFPGETKKQFQNTVKLLKEVKFNKAYIAKYSPRPGTAAFKLKDNVSPEEKKRRWHIINQIIYS